MAYCADPFNYHRRRTRTVHIGGKLKSTNQGGQGALRPRVYVNTQLHY